MKSAKWLKALILIFVTPFFIFTGINSISLPDENSPKYIILLIGDGMGLAHITAAKVSKGSLVLEKMPVVGFVITWAFGRDFITDSAASATALSTGTKTSNGRIGKSAAGEDLETILEIAEKKGLSTGLIATSSITHATPASFAAHVNNRSQQFEIAKQISQKDIEVLIGGGRQYFIPEDLPDGKRKDGENLISLMVSRRYLYIDSVEKLKSLNPEKTEKLLALLEPEALPPASKRNYSLGELSEIAIEILKKDPDGFFLMVEGSQIDWAAHANEKDNVIDETIDFDEAIGSVLDFAFRNSEKTLVLVTADHETGGFGILGGSADDRNVEGKFLTRGHTGVMVPLLAFGMKSDLFGGIKSNDEIGRILINILNEE
ncbi:MAG: alkaline phosphatase [Fidelibacterota bacterium]